jgi:1,4-alpha-glucan branching enzyme
MALQFLCRLFVFLLFLAACASFRPGTEVRNNDVHFALYAPSAKSVSVAGSFNRWDPRANPLTGPDENGVWITVVSLPPGRYEYLFLMNGEEWLPDPSAPPVDDGMGGKNSVVEVEGTAPDTLHSH